MTICNGVLVAAQVGEFDGQRATALLTQHRLWQALWTVTGRTILSANPAEGKGRQAVICALGSERRSY